MRLLFDNKFNFVGFSTTVLGALSLFGGMIFLVILPPLVFLLSPLITAVLWFYREQLPKDWEWNPQTHKAAFIFLNFMWLCFMVAWLTGFIDKYWC